MKQQREEEDRRYREQIIAASLAVILRARERLNAPYVPGPKDGCNCEVCIEANKTLYPQNSKSASQRT